ncbi:MAG: DUF4062 domain-containing protein [Lachnospiraceae bacterium]|nr:DUF4062 domain-containing protein [Lachnospiraceae bacterium]
MKKIFISSTFKDMQYERDILHEDVLPRLNAAAMEYGDALSMCDLRWGVDTSFLSEAESARKVLSVCLDEIDRCRPYMIIIIGARYGWIPDSSTAQDLVRHRIESLKDLRRSVTEMEIEYGALSRKLDGRCLFYFRNADYSMFPETYQSEDPEHARLMEELKDRIRRLTGGRALKEYTISWNPETKRPEGVETFAGMVTEDVTQLMRSEWEARLQMTEWEKDSLLQWNQADEKVQQFAARDGLIASVTELLHSGRSLVALRGPSGSGKSMLMAKLAAELKEEGGAVFPYFCGSSSLTGTALNLVRSMLHGIQEELDPESTVQLNDLEDENGLAEALGSCVLHYNESCKRPLTILIDAVDQLAADRFRDQFRFLPADTGENVRIVMSMLDSFAVPEGLQTEIVHVGDLDLEEKAEVIRGILGFQSKELDGSVIEKICEKNSSGNPLYLSILLRRLLMMDREDFAWITSHGDGQTAITEYEIKLIGDMPDSLARASVSVIDHALQKMNSYGVRAAAALISMSRFGMRPEDIQGITGLMSGGKESLSLLDFSLFTGYLQSFFIVREDGRYDFSHRIIKEAMLLHWKTPEKLHGAIAYWLSGLDPRDSVRRSELIWHCFGSRQTFPFLSCMEGEDEALYPAAQTLKDCVRRDKEGWIPKQITALSARAGSAQIHFLLDIFPKTLSGTWDDLVIGRIMLRALLEMLEKSGLEPADQADAADCRFFCLYRLGKLCGRMGERYREEMKSCLEKACGIYGAGEIKAALDRGMPREKAEALIDAYLSLIQIRTEEKRFEEIKGLFEIIRPIHRAACGRIIYDIPGYTRVSLEEAVHHFTPAIISEVRARFLSGDPDRKRSAAVLLEGQLAEAELLEGKEPGSVSEELIRLKETKAWMLQSIDEPVFHAEAGRLAQEIISSREQQLARDPSGENLSRLSAACRQAGELALASEDPEGRREGFDLVMRSVKLEQQRAVLLGTEESLRALLASYTRLEELYAGRGGIKELETAVSISDIRIRLGEAGYRRWPSEALLRLWFTACLSACRHCLDLNSTEGRKKALEYGKECFGPANRPEGGPYYIMHAQQMWAEIAAAFGGENNLKIASNALRKAEQAAKEGLESGNEMVSLKDLYTVWLQLAGVLSGRKEREESDQETEELYIKSLEGFEELCGKRPEDIEAEDAFIKCLQHTADYYMARNLPGKADEALAKADSLSEKRCAGQTRTEVWEKRCSILSARVRAARAIAVKAVPAERSAVLGQIDRISRDLLTAGRQVNLASPGRRSLSALADCYGNWAEAKAASGIAGSKEVMDLYDSCLSMARKAVRQFLGADSAGLFMKWVRQALPFFFAQKEEESWELGMRMVVEGFQNLEKAAADWACTGEDAEEKKKKAGQLLQREADRIYTLASGFLEQKDALDYFRVMCYMMRGMTYTEKDYAYRKIHGLDYQVMDAYLSDQALYAGVQYTQARNIMKGAYSREAFDELMQDLVPAARKLLEEDPSPANRKRIIYIADLHGYYQELLDDKGNASILDMLHEGEEQAEALMAEGDPEGGRLTKKMYQDLAAVYSTTGPVKYAGKVREYKKKAKKIAE